MYSETLIGFSEYATKGLDKIYDATRFGRGDGIYSMLSERQLAIQEFVATDKLVVERKQKQVELDLNETLDGLWIDDGKLRMSIRVVQQSQLQPRDILAALGLHDVLREGATLTRTKIELIS